ncbi:Trypsin [Roseovarius litorisediminis]|uniref:Serine protease n=1 Tax=Roseovarius litorisediminis TaxID=1312363 RepID=A0A1Y5T6I4_9RHOB|nr:Trypsin [Roseovarius litorisediminis]
MSFYNKTTAALVASAAFFCTALTAQADGSGLIRLTDRDDLFGWEAVGRIEIGDDAYCTGVLIAPDLVLTAAHCVYGPGGSQVSAAEVKFRAGLRDGVAIAEREVSNVAAHQSYNPALGFSAETIRFDAALLKLSQPISSSEAAPFALRREVNKGQRVSVVSYGRGRDNALSWQRDCGLLGRGKGLMAFDCNITFGSSGAPVFVREGGRARILSLISGGNVGGGSPRAYGMDLAPLVDRLKRDLRAQPKAPLKQAKSQRIGVPRD